MQAEEDVVFSENANMFARVLLYTKRVSVRLSVYQQRGGGDNRSARASRERYDDGGDVDIKRSYLRWIIFLLFAFLWRFAVRREKTNVF